MDKETEHWMVSMQVALNDATREVIFGPAHTQFRGRTNATRKQEIQELVNQIDAMIKDCVSTA